MDAGIGTRITRGTIFGIVVALVAVCLLATEHLTHISRFVPYALILACPLMHLFGGHGVHRHGHRHRDSDGHT